MALTKREIENLNEELQLEIARLKAENESLKSSLANAAELAKLWQEQFAKLETRYRQLKSSLVDYLTDS